MSTSQWESPVTPAQLSFLAVYSPSLGLTEESFKDQVVYYYSRAARDSKRQATDQQRKTSGKTSADTTRPSNAQQAEHEKLRQIGLAQGMVNFANDFSDGEPVTSIETERSRIVLNQLEPGWWILASIDLTRLPAASPSVSSTGSYEYSSREVSPPALLLQQIKTAHNIFILHHGPSLSGLFARLGRDRFGGVLDRYWSRFCKDWDVLLHGNPAIDSFGGLKLASGGELGMGVGEEEWGSGERDVLEDLMRQTEGLVDVVVSRFGEPVCASAGTDDESQLSDDLPWLGRGFCPQAHDGVVFGGRGALSRPCLRNVAAWTESLYVRGEFAYGVSDNPQRPRRKRPKPEPASHDRRPVASMHAEQSLTSRPSAQRTTIALQPAVPPPIIKAVEDALHEATDRVDKISSGSAQAGADNKSTMSSAFGSSEKWVRYLTLGLGSVKGKPDSQRPPPAVSRISTASSKTLRTGAGDDTQVKDIDSPVTSLELVSPVPDGQALANKIAVQRQKENDGYFFIGYRGDLQADAKAENTAAEVPDDNDDRLLIRTVQVQCPSVKVDGVPDEGKDTTSSSSSIRDDLEYRRLRVVVYVRRPFIYVFLFEHQTDTLKMSTFYKALHRHLQPLHTPLLASTSFAQVSRRIANAQVFPCTASETSSIRSTSLARARPAPVFDLLYDPLTLAIHTSIPNIPAPGTIAAEGMSARKDHAPWTRVEALNVHMQILNTLDGTPRRCADLERTSKTSRGWWVVWLRVPPSAIRRDEIPLTYASADAPDAQYEPHGNSRPEDCRVAFLVRKASDWSAGDAVKASFGSRLGSGAGGMFGFGRRSADRVDSTSRRGSPLLGASSEGAKGWSADGLESGIGVDARKYVEGLLSLNR